MKTANISTDTNENQEVTFKAEVEVTDAEIEKLKKNYPAELKHFSPSVEGNTLILTKVKQYKEDDSEQDFNIDKDRFKDDVESHLKVLFPSQDIATH